MTIWMLQSKKNFVVGIIGVLIILFAISNFLTDNNAPISNQQSPDPAFRFPTEKPTSEQSSTFSDINGYSPTWAQNIGDNQIEAKCTSIMLDIDQLFSRDYKWCDEFTGYLLDKMSGQVENTIKSDQGYFVDTTGYTPEWAKGIGESQASMKCSNIMLNGKGNSYENSWCMEYLGYLLDKSN